MTKKYDYDVALSFAGEDREYVEEVAEFLRKSDLKVFYDRFEEVNLWGKNLYSYLSDIYKDKARYTVIFISKHYALKLWTNHERESAQARAFEENEEYILPARFDGTDIPGILKTIGFIDLTKVSPTEFGQLVYKKIFIHDSTISNRLPIISSDSPPLKKGVDRLILKKASLNQIEMLIAFATSPDGLGKYIGDARGWAIDNYEKISIKYEVATYISEMKRLIAFATSPNGLGKYIGDARRWALENNDRYIENKIV